MGSSPGVMSACAAAALPAGFGVCTVSTEAPCGGSWRASADCTGRCGLDASWRLADKLAGMPAAAARMCGDCGRLGGRRRAARTRHASDLVLQVDGLGHQPHFFGATASTISCTGIVRVVAPCVSEETVVGTLRIFTGVTTTPSCTKGVDNTTFRQQQSIRRRHDVGPRLPRTGTALARHVHGNTGQQIEMVAFFQFMHTLEFARVQGNRTLALAECRRRYRATCPGAESLFP